MINDLSVIVKQRNQNVVTVELRSDEIRDLKSALAITITLLTIAENSNGRLDLKVYPLNMLETNVKKGFFIKSGIVFKTENDINIFSSRSIELLKKIQEASK